MYINLLDFLNREMNFFIEAEGKTRLLEKFIEEYNLTHSPCINLGSEGIIRLEDNSNKWGLELRLYVKSCPPENLRILGFKPTSTYRSDYPYRLNNNEIVKFLLKQGYRIGVN